MDFDTDSAAAAAAAAPSSDQQHPSGHDPTQMTCAPPPPPPPHSTSASTSILASRSRFLQSNNNPLRASIFDTGLVVQDILPESRLHLVTRTINPLDRLKRDAPAILHSESVLKSHRQWTDSFIHSQPTTSASSAEQQQQQDEALDRMDVDQSAHPHSSSRNVDDDGAGDDDDDGAQSAPSSSDDSESDSESEHESAPILVNGADSTATAQDAGALVAHDPIMSAPDKAHFTFDEMVFRRAEIDQSLLQYLSDIGHLNCILDALLAAPPPNPHPLTNTIYEPDAIIRKHFHAIAIDKPDLPARHKLDHLLYMHAHHRALLASIASQLGRGAADLAAIVHADHVFFQTHALALRTRGWPLSLPPPPPPGKPNPGAVMVDFGIAPYVAAYGMPFPWPRALLYRVFPGQVVSGMDDTFPVPLSDEPIKPDAHTVVRVSPYLRVYLQVGGSAGRRREFSVRRERAGAAAAAASEAGERIGPTAATATGVQPPGATTTHQVVTAATAYARRARARGAVRNKDRRHEIDTILRRAQANYVTTYQLFSMVSDVAQLGPSYGYSSASVKDEEGRIVVPLGGAGDLMISMEEVPGSSDEEEEEGVTQDEGEGEGVGEAGDLIKSNRKKRRKERKRKRATEDADGDVDMTDAAPSSPSRRQPPASAATSVQARQPDTSIRSMLDPLLLAMDMPLFDFVQWVEFSDFVRDIHAHVRRALQLARIVLPDASGVRMHVPQECEVSSSSLAADRGARGGRSGEMPPAADPAADAESWSGLEIQVFLTPRARAPRAAAAHLTSTVSHLLLDRTSLPVFILGLSPPCKLFVRVHDAIRFRNLTPTSRQIQDLVNHHVERELANQVIARVSQWAVAGHDGADADAVRVKVSVDWEAQGAGGPRVKLSVYAAGEGAVAAAGGLEAAAQGGGMGRAVQVERFGPGWVERALVELGVI